ncbi:Uncharacterized protein TCM_031402 [Theobroma cacao]|uniref:Uncharacterized protein n=1 Tax=Theobroma cacao TaxID=3641 RepID=A0A061F756_THECC|nr:Uncharacterized protein TCM_031402 [Theobroma cacao]
MSSTKTLILSRNNIKEWQFAILKSLSNLSCLKLDNNPLRQLREVPSEIMSLCQLQILDLSQNSLQSIPEGLNSLTSLIELDLSDKNISALPLKLVKTRKVCLNQSSKCRETED